MSIIILITARKHKIVHCIIFYFLAAIVSAANYAIYVQLITCESEVAMLERRKLTRAMISHFLRKCCFSRRSERRAPSIPRALKRSEKARV